MLARLLCTLLVLAPTFAQEGAPSADLVDAAIRHVADGHAWLAKLPATAEGTTPRETDQGFQAADGAALLEIAPGLAEKRGGVRGYLAADGRLYVRVEGQKGWRGPQQVILVTRKLVHRELEKHKSDSGQQGFYVGRYRKMAHKLGAPAAPHLLAIAGDPTDPQLQQLAIEALGQLGYKSVIPGLERLLGDRRFQQRFGQMLTVALARLGKTERFDQLIKRYDDFANNQARDAAERARAKSTIALLWSQLGKHDKALDYYLDATKIDPNNALAFYNLACTYAKLGRKDDAFKALDASVTKGFDQFEWMRMDGDLKPLRKDPRWKKLLRRQFEKPQ